MPAEAFSGHTLGEVLPDVRCPDDVLGQVLADGEPREVTLTGTTHVASPPHGRRLWRAVYHRLELPGWGVCLAGTGVEISDLRRYLDDLETAHLRLALLDAAATRVGTTLDIETTCLELAESLVPSLADVTAAAIVEDDFHCAPPPRPGMVRLRKMKGSVPPELEWQLRELGGPGPYVDLPRSSATRHCMNTGRPWLGNLASEELFRKVTVDPERAAIFRRAGIHSLLIVPLVAAGRSIGVVLLGRAGASEPFTEDDVETVQGLAARAALSIDSARRYSHEHTMALELQRAPLSEPSSPHPGTEVAARYLPSGRRVLAGRRLVRLPPPAGLTHPAGHGRRHGTRIPGRGRHEPIPLTAADRGRLGHGRREDPRRVRPPSGAPRPRPARHLPPRRDGPAGRLLHAGQCRTPATRARTAGSRHRGALAAPGPPIGTGLGGYESITVPMERGATLLLYTDGLAERRGTDNDVSLKELAALRLPADGALDDLLDPLLSGMANGAYEDDVAILAARQP